MHAQHLTTTQPNNGIFFLAKFDQNTDVQPLSTIGAMFNELCDVFVQEATHSQLESVERALESALGTQAALLSAVVPSLEKLMPSCGGFVDSSLCVDSALSMRFLFCEFLVVIATHCPKITVSFFIDDLHWADPISLLLIGTLISSIEGRGSSVFFICCYRDDEVDDNVPLTQWLLSISLTSLEMVELQEMTMDSVNTLLSETLHLSPLKTRPLSSVLHHKTRGNSLFLKQLIGSLQDQHLIEFNLGLARWTWDLNTIMDSKISEDVVLLLLNQMQQLPADQVFALKVMSCLGSSVKCTILDVLSSDMSMNLQEILQQVSQRGFLDSVNCEMFRFAHDKIQQVCSTLFS